MPSRRSGLAIKTALICLSGLLAGTCWPSGDNGLEVFPKHFLLHPGEQIHYTVLERSEGNHLRFADAQFSVEDPVIIRLIKPSGIFEAVRRGRAQILVRTSTSETRITIEVSGRARPPLMAVPYSVIRELVARDLLFVGHANLDGFDHTAVAKVGIDHHKSLRSVAGQSFTGSVRNIRIGTPPTGTRTTRSSARDRNIRFASTLNV